MRKDDHIARVATRRRAERDARRLGWLSIGVGLVELLAPHALARATGMRGSESLLRLCGVREIATGIGLLRDAEPDAWMWARLGGDAIDAAALAAQIARGSNDPLRAAGALAAVVGVAAIDLRCALSLGAANASSATGAATVRPRSGFPQPPEAMRGAALSSFTTPIDMVGPQAMRAWTAKR